jgi:chloramphenicol 3-O-phosphotransferase
MAPEQAVYIVTGPSAAGKTTVGRKLAERFTRGVHLEGDFFRRSVVAGRREVTPEADREALEQLLLRYRLGAAAADAYFDAGFTVVLEDVIAGELLLDTVALVRSRPLHVVVLLPSAEAIAAREAAREESGYTRWSIEQLHDGFVHGNTRLGLWLDNSQQSPDESVDEILTRKADSEIADMDR